MCGHRSGSNECSSRVLVALPGALIELIEVYPCKNADALHAREGMHQELAGALCINACRAGARRQPAREARAAALQAARMAAIDARTAALQAALQAAKEAKLAGIASRQAARAARGPKTAGPAA